MKSLESSSMSHDGHGAGIHGGLKRLKDNLASELGVPAKGEDESNSSG